MKKLIILTIWILYSCSNKNNSVELEIVSNKILSSKIETNRVKNIIEYRIINNTDKTYYFNAYSVSKLTWKIKGIQPSNVFIQFLDKKGNYVESGQKEYLPTEEYSIYEKIKYEIENKETKELNYSIPSQYKKFQDKNNFVLHKGESKYFEILSYFPNSDYSFVNLNPNNEYTIGLLIYSDSTNYKKILSRTTLKTIKDNGYEVYHGIIKSNNKIPIKFVD